MACIKHHLCEVDQGILNQVPHGILWVKKIIHENKQETFKSKLFITLKNSIASNLEVEKSVYRNFKEKFLTCMMNLTISMSFFSLEIS